jgi:hypothetical protein
VVGVGLGSRLGLGLGLASGLVGLGLRLGLGPRMGLDLALGICFCLERATGVAKNRSSTLDSQTALSKTACQCNLRSERRRLVTRRLVA